jgi:hypothetical protein
VAKNQGTTSEQGRGSSGLSHGKLRRLRDTQRRPSSATHAAVKAKYAAMAKMRLLVTWLVLHASVVKVIGKFRHWAAHVLSTRS